MRWTVVIPAKSLPAAKSRLAPLTAGADEHRRLVSAIRADTTAAAQAAAGVARVLVVTDAGDPSPGLVVQSRPGLNAALREAADHARRHWPDDGVAALVGDLPALRPDELAATLAAAAAVPAGFVMDAEGTGTTLLTAAPGTALRPLFGAGSAARHARHAQPLTAGPGLRRDVDHPDDLRGAARELGVGPETSEVLATLAGAAAGCSSCVGMMPQ